jgi:aminomethyltransferase
LTKLDLSKFHFGMFTVTDLAGIPCFVTRTGYTGEDGFEISVPNERALELTERLMAADGGELCGATCACPRPRVLR